MIWRMPKEAFEIGGSSLIWVAISKALALEWRTDRVASRYNEEPILNLGDFHGRRAYGLAAAY